MPRDRSKLSVSAHKNMYYDRHENEFQLLDSSRIR